MGCVSSCFLVDGDNERGHPNAPGSRYCVCLRCLTQQLVNAYTVLFRRGEAHVAPLSLQGRAPLVSAPVDEESSISNTYHAPPRPLPYDDPRCSPLHRQLDGFVPRYNKASRHSHAGPPRTNDTDIEPTGTVDGQNCSVYVGSKLCLSESSVKHPAPEVSNREAYNFFSSEEEDVCPTCLEEYTFENPRITLQCSHDYHLGCIYEWMERSEACPVCGKVMMFNETT
ncbi:E3 ubiquitin-protein ligase-like [Iris pallida]|uniref:RING-type E3 ubiquitin transferase n=1 Tax=Iris pallida TaxID=29817 RepID=A0AAX6IFA6_IRIPA|nr:E3 ubiquitin-protein ligase-like [Iris pallida]KAJ6851623.1 E3 ubiquitin-protein ligase-like [Iris pallida]